MGILNIFSSSNVQASNEPISPVNRSQTSNPLRRIANSQSDPTASPRSQRMNAIERTFESSLGAMQAMHENNKERDNQIAELKRRVDRIDPVLRQRKKVEKQIPTQTRHYDASASGGWMPRQTVTLKDDDRIFNVWNHKWPFNAQGGWEDGQSIQIQGPRPTWAGIDPYRLTNKNLGQSVDGFIKARKPHDD